MGLVNSGPGPGARGPGPGAVLSGRPAPGSALPSRRSGATLRDASAFAAAAPPPPRRRRRRLQRRGEGSQDGRGSRGARAGEPPAHRRPTPGDRCRRPDGGPQSADAEVVEAEAGGRGGPELVSRGLRGLRGARAGEPPAHSRLTPGDRCRRPDGGPQSADDEVVEASEPPRAPQPDTRQSVPEAGQRPAECG